MEACGRMDQQWDAKPEDTMQKDERRRFVGKETVSTLTTTTIWLSALQ